MDANQRSEANNQTNNGANEKWTPGSEGASADRGQPLDHTYAHGAGAQQGNQQRDVMGNEQGGVGSSSEKNLGSTSLFTFSISNGS